MITADKLKTYEAFNGDIDAWARASSDRDKEIISDADWYEIERLVNELVLLERSQTTDDFARRIEEQLRENTADASVAERIRYLASVDGVRQKKSWWKFW